MAEAKKWYEKAYAGGPMVDVPGFPRPLYPPDAAKQGKQPSIDGPDVVAYKRTISRLGRWPWQPFDDAYANAFSHGSGPNVIDSGVAGFQRQQNIDDTGWIGKGTFNALRSARVPAELPHGGEMGMDAVAQSLIVDAWNEFHGAPTPATGAGKARLDRAKAEIGVMESPMNSNNQKYGKWYGMNGQPWCAMFVTWADQTGPSPTSAFKKGSRYSYVPYILNDARAGRNGLSITQSPKPGDLVIYDWEMNDEPDHIGLFESFVSHDSTTSFNAIEGNTSIDNNSNGGQVMRRTRTRDNRISFVRVADK